jgi:membrane-associated protease RseP (regulator of RpoE activity)
MFVLLFVVAIVFVIMFHEFGHFATAKAFGMKVEKFFLSFGPTLWSFRRGETEYGVKAIPAGGFVKISGMNRFEEVDPADHGRLFYEQPAWQRVIVLVAGSATHFLVAFALIWGALAFVGAPTDEPTTTVDALLEDSPAQAAGLQPGDEFVSVDGQPATDWPALQEAIAQRAGQTVPLVVRRDGAERTLQVEVGSRDGSGYIGVYPASRMQDYSVGTALAETVSGEQWSLGTITGLSLRGIAEVFTPDSLGRFFAATVSGEPRTVEEGGPISLVGAGQMVSSAGASGNIFFVLLLLAQLNIVLGALNMLPLPPLDGGHVAVLLIEEAVNGVRRLRGRPTGWALDPSVVTPIALAVILFFGVVGITAIVNDIARPLQLQ